MMTNDAADKVITAEQFVSLVPHDAFLAIGGVLLRRKPMRLIELLCADDRPPLRIASFLGSLDVEWLAVHQRISSLTTGYVGMETLGPAPAWSDALEKRQATMRESSELMFVSGLRASAAGLPFMPSRGAQGSDLATEANLEHVVCPYTGQVLWAMPALRPDVAVIHTEQADRFGNVDRPSEQDFLWDTDLLLARAAKTVIVSVERIVPTADLIHPVLFAHEVHHVFLAPYGAAPTELPGCYPADLAGITAYLAAVAQGEPPAAALAQSFLRRS